MTIFSVITLLGGVAFFLYGMNVMSSGLEKLAGSKLEIFLKKMTSNKAKGFLLGFLCIDGYAGWFGQFRNYATQSNHWRFNGF